MRRVRGFVCSTALAVTMLAAIPSAAVAQCLCSGGPLDDGLCTNNADCLGYPCANCDHVKCYRVKDPLRLTAATAPWLDLAGPEFGAEDCEIVSSYRLYCTPVTKDVTAPVSRRFVPPGGPYLPFNPSPLANTPNLLQDQLCYRIKCNPTVIPDRDVEDQFASRRIEFGKAVLLCGPAEEPLPTTTTTTTTTTTSTTTTTCVGAPPPFAIGSGSTAVASGDPDPLWNFVSGPAGTPGPALAVIPPYPGWSTLTGTNWIASDNVCNIYPPGTPCVAGTYVYRTCWTQVCAGSVSLTLLADNSASATLTHVPTGNTTVVGATVGPTNGFQIANALVATQPTLSGQSCLTVVVDNLGGATGMNLSGTVTQ